jgi:hypothetical protein
MRRRSGNPLRCRCPTTSPSGNPLAADEQVGESRCPRLDAEGNLAVKPNGFKLKKYKLFSIGEALGRATGLSNKCGQNACACGGRP